MSVVFPAPFPPTTPTTSPALRSIVTPATARTPPNATWMFRSSTSGTRCTGALGVSIGVIIVRSAHPPAEQRVEPDRGDQHEADNDVLSWGVDEQKNHARAKRLHHDRAEDRAGDRSDAARE